VDVVFIRMALTALLALGLFPVACHRTAPVQSSGGGGPLTKDTTHVVVPVTDASVVAVFKDTAPARVFVPEARDFKLQTPGQRQSFQSLLRKERELWEANKPRDYQFLLRVDCFCPGTRGWLLMEVRTGEPLRAWDRTGKTTALTDWNTFSIDGLYDNLERSIDRDGEVQIAFDPRWHFPSYVRTVAVPGPDAWSIVEVRALRSIVSVRPN
jgi:hypothetical protein